MDRNGSVEIFRVSVRRRLLYPAMLALAAIAALLKWRFDADPLLFSGGCIFLPASLLLFWYLNHIRLTIGPQSIILQWPFQDDKSLRWSEIVQVRRSENRSPTHFFVDLTASADRAIQFNPYFFDRPDDILEKLNEYLESDISKDSTDLEKAASYEIALAAETPASPQINWFLPALIGLIVIILLFVIVL